MINAHVSIVKSVYEESCIYVFFKCLLKVLWSKNVADNFW